MTGIPAYATSLTARLIPLATILIAVIAGLVWRLTSYGFTISVPVKTVQAYVAAGQITPVLPITRSHIGGWAVLVPITGFTAALASFGASLYAAGRITYALSREGFISPYFKGPHRDSGLRGGPRQRRQR